MASQITTIQNFANVLVIHRMTREFETGNKIPQIYPASTDYNSDLSIELLHKDSADGKSKHQVALIHSTGHNYACNSDYQMEVMDPTPEMVLSAARIPTILW